MTQTFQIFVDKAEDFYQVVRFHGEMDKSGYTEVKANLDEIVNGFKLKTLVFDFSNLKFINSESIGYLTDVYSRLYKNDQALVLVGPSQYVSDVLKTIGILEIIPVFETLGSFLSSNKK